MPQNLYYSEELAEEDANKKSIKARDLDGTQTLSAGQDITVLRERRPDDKVQWFGHGTDDDEGRTAYKYADIVASGAGTGAQGDPIEGEVVVAITDSDGNVLADHTVGSCEELREMAGEARTDRDRFPALAPWMKQGRYREVLINVDDTSDGVQLDTDASSGRIPYSQTRN
jgi:hypothetical protein